MDVAFVDGDEPDDVDGNVYHIEAADLTPAEVEEVLDGHDGDVEPDQNAPEGTERWMAFGWTSTGRHTRSCSRSCATTVSL